MSRPTRDSAATRSLRTRIEAKATGRLTIGVGSPSGGAAGDLSVHLLNGDVLGATARDDDRQLVRMLHLRGILDDNRAEDLESLADSGGDVFGEVLSLVDGSASADSGVVDGILRERFVQNLCDFVSSQSTPRWFEQKGVFIANIQMGHVTAALVDEVCRLSDLAKAIDPATRLVRGKGRLPTSNGVVDPIRSAVAEALSSDPRPVSALLAELAVEPTRARVILAELLLDNVASMPDYPDVSASDLEEDDTQTEDARPEGPRGPPRSDVPAPVREFGASGAADGPPGRTVAASENGVKTAPPLRPSPVRTAPPLEAGIGGVGGTPGGAPQRSVGPAQPVAIQSGPPPVKAKPPAKPVVVADVSPSRAGADLDPALMDEDLPEVEPDPISDDGDLPPELENELEASEFETTRPLGAVPPIKRPPGPSAPPPDQRPAPQAGQRPAGGAGKRADGDWSPETDLPEPLGGDQKGAPQSLSDYLEKTSVVSDEELDFFSDHDHDSRGGEKDGSFRTDTHNLDRIDVSVEDEAPPVRKPPRQQQASRSAAPAKPAVEELEAEEVPSAKFAAPTLSEEEAIAKIDVANDVLGKVAAALDEAEGAGRGHALLELLVEGAPSQFAALFADVRVGEDVILRAGELIRNLAGRPPTEHRPLLTNGLFDILERAISAASDELPDEAVDALLESTAGYRTRLGR